MASTTLAGLSHAEWDPIIERFRVPGYPAIYVLGSFARHQTLYSQQVRALNLVAALWKTKNMIRESRVAVVGGDAAGLMAAAGAAFLGTRNVRLLDQPKGGPAANPAIHEAVGDYLARSVDWRMDA
jgi:hypothetical protein